MKAELMSQCGHCGAKANDAFLCRNCESDLHEMLQGLPRWLRYLHDAAIGDTRLGESARRSADQTSPMPCNLTASELYDNTHAVLANWAQIVSLRTETLNIPGKEEK